jgi:hypothetical protein
VPDEVVADFLRFGWKVTKVDAASTAPAPVEPKPEPESQPEVKPEAKPEASKADGS